MSNTHTSCRLKGTDRNCPCPLWALSLRDGCYLYPDTRCTCKHAERSYYCSRLLPCYPCRPCQPHPTPAALLPRITSLTIVVVFMIVMWRAGLV